MKHTYDSGMLYKHSASKSFAINTVGEQCFSSKLMPKIRSSSNSRTTGKSNIYNSNLVFILHYFCTVILMLRNCVCCCLSLGKKHKIWRKRSYNIILHLIKKKKTNYTNIKEMRSSAPKSNTQKWLATLLCQSKFQLRKIGAQMGCEIKWTNMKTFVSTLIPFDCC